MILAVSSRSNIDPISQGHELKLQPYSSSCASVTWTGCIWTVCHICSFDNVPHENLQAIDRISVLACVCTDHKLRASPHIKARTPASKGNASNHNAATQSLFCHIWTCALWQLQLQFTYMGNSHHGFQSQYIAHCNHSRDYIMWDSTILLTHMSDCSVQCTIKIGNSETTIANAQCLSKH